MGGIRASGDGEVILLTERGLGHDILPVDLVKLTVIGTGKSIERSHTIVLSGSTISGKELSQ